MPPRHKAVLLVVLTGLALLAAAGRPAPARASVCSLPVANTVCEAGKTAGKTAGDLVHGHVGRAASDVAHGAVNTGCSITSPVLSGTCRAVVHGATSAVGDVVSGHPGRIITDAVGGATGAVTGALTSWVTDGVAGLLGDIGHVISKTSSPVLSARWFRGPYLTMMGVAALVAVPLLLLLVVQAALQQSFGLLAAGVAKTVLAFVMAGAAVVVVQLLVGVTDELSATVTRTTGVDLVAWFGHLAKALGALPGVGLFIVFVVGVITALAGLAVWIELLIREAGVYIVCFFLPLILVAMIWPATARWTRRGVELLVAIIFAKFLLVAIVSLGAAAAGQPGPHPSLNAALVGTGILILAAFSPFTVLALVPHAEHALSVSRGSSHAGLLAGSGTAQVMRGMQVAGAFAGPEGAALAAVSTAGSRSGPGGPGAGTDTARAGSGPEPHTSADDPASGQASPSGETPDPAPRTTTAAATGGSGQGADGVVIPAVDSVAAAPGGSPVERPSAPLPDVSTGPPSAPLPDAPATSRAPTSAPVDVASTPTAPASQSVSTPASAPPGSPPAPVAPSAGRGVVTSRSSPTSDPPGASDLRPVEPPAEKADE